MAEQQFVAFKLNSQLYAADIRNVGGIIEYTHITKIPNIPDFIEGVINLRGKIIQIINLKKYFNMENTTDCSDRRIVLYQIDGVDIGLIVDDASQVLKLDDADIEAPPEMIHGIRGNYIRGIGKLNESIIILLDLSRILTVNENLATASIPVSSIQLIADSCPTE